MSDLRVLPVRPENSVQFLEANSMNATCPTTKELRSLSLGQLPEEQSDNLILHLRQCETCQMEMESLDDSDDTFVEQLKSVSSDSQNEFLGEDDCRIASARALAALASAETEYGTTMDRIPKTIGEYEIIRPIGRGGMGQVYLGRHTKLGRKVAVKVIANHRRWDERTQKRFASEMKNIGRLDRFASASPESQVVYQATPEAPTACVLGIMLFGLGGRCASTGDAANASNAKARIM